MNTFLCAGAALALHAAAAGATDIVYTPVNPSFGGSSLNGPILLNQANAINKYQDPAVTDALSRLNNQSPLEQFNKQLEAVVANNLATAAAGAIIDTTTTPGKAKFVPGTLETANFIFTVTQTSATSVKVVTFDKVTGSTTSFDLQQ
jgi:curli production assembly/transport component CsgF